MVMLVGISNWILSLFIFGGENLCLLLLIFLVVELFGQESCSLIGTS